jgi:hypothetical protein
VDLNVGTRLQVDNSLRQQFSALSNGGTSRPGPVRSDLPAMAVSEEFISMDLRTSALVGIGQLGPTRVVATQVLEIKGSGANSR